MSKAIVSKESIIKLLQDKLESGVYTQDEYNYWFKLFFPTPEQKIEFKKHVASCLYGLN
jgi:hypothetical protein